ncbi:hypothetical protein GGR52DRAFT_588790 [Hypoxylon sp. FL1284]|nr:hypothetical protein GGR52DRAFT_588790 [Hypoxylon sp. FL1284]
MASERRPKARKVNYTDHPLDEYLRVEEEVEKEQAGNVMMDPIDNVINDNLVNDDLDKAINDLIANAMNNNPENAENDNPDNAVGENLDNFIDDDVDNAPAESSSPAATLPEATLHIQLPGGEATFGPMENPTPQAVTQDQSAPDNQAPVTPSGQVDMSAPNPFYDGSDKSYESDESEDEGPSSPLVPQEQIGGNGLVAPSPLGPNNAEAIEHRVEGEVATMDQGGNLAAPLGQGGNLAAPLGQGGNGIGFRSAAAWPANMQMAAAAMPGSQVFTYHTIHCLPEHFLALEVIAHAQHLARRGLGQFLFYVNRTTLYAINGNLCAHNYAQYRWFRGIMAWCRRDNTLVDPREFYSVVDVVGDLHREKASRGIPDGLTPFCK